MLEIKKYIETANGDKYPVIFSFNVLEEIQNRYDSFDNWSHVIEGEELVNDKWEKKEPKIKDIKYFIKVAINEGIDLENEKNNTKKPFLTDKQVGRLISEVGVAKISRIIKEVIQTSTLGTTDPEETEETKN